MTKKKQAPGKRVLTARCTVVALVVVADEKKMRRSFLTKYRQKVKALQADSDRLRHYQEVDNPDFTQWLDREFGKVRSRLLEAQNEVREIRYLIGLIQDYADIMEVPVHKAHRIITSAKANGRLESVVDLLNDELRAQDQRDAENEVEDEELGQEPSPGQQEPNTESQGGIHEPSQSRQRPKDKNDNVKTLYRQLVRLLHPDLIESQTPEQARLWHDVQKAYAWEDLEKLEEIWKSLQTGGEPVVDYQTMPLGEILSLQKAVEKRLEQIRSQIKKLKSEPDWNFTAVKSDAKKIRTLKRDLHFSFELGMSYASREQTELQELMFYLSVDPRDKQRSHNRSQRTRIEDLFG